MDAEKARLYGLLRESVRELSKGNELYSPLPPVGDEGASLESAGLDPLLLPDVLRELKRRLGGRDLAPVLGNASALVTLGDLLSALAGALGNGIPSPRMVYVDDEDANLFIFRRRFDKYFKVEYFRMRSYGFLRLRMSGDPSASNSS